jgi:hypothetical protein
METSHSISNHNQNKEWPKEFYWLSFFLRVQSVLQYAAQVKMNARETWTSLRSVKNFAQLHQQIQRVTVQINLGQIVNRLKVYIRTRKLSARLIVGIFLVGCVAPVCDFFYSLSFLQNFEAFNKDTQIDYLMPLFENYFYLSYCIGPYLDKLFTTWGLYLVFVGPEAKKRWIAILAIVFAVSRALWILQANNDIELQGWPSFAYWIYGFILTWVLWKVSNYLLYMYNHKTLNQKSTMDNITNNRKDLPAEKVVEMYATTWEKMKATNY